MRNLFWWFLFIQILSPEVDGWAIWLYLLFPLFDQRFISRLPIVLARLGARRQIGLLLLISAAITTLEPSIVFKAMLLLITSSYVTFLVRRGDTAFDLPIVFQTGIAAVQFTGAVFFDADWFNPSNIGKAIWGSYALSGGGQLAEGLVLFTRVSGLCREPGFFSSIVSAAILLMVTFKPDISQKRKTFFFICATLSLLLAFSKISIIIALLIGFAMLSRWVIQRVNGALFLPVVILVLVSITTVLFDVTKMADDPLSAWQGGSIFFRTVGYYLIGKMDFYDFIFGLKTPYVQYAVKYPFLTLSEWWGYDKYLFDGTGVAYLIVTGGLISLVLAIGVAWSFRIRAIAIVIYCAFLLNANPFTLSAFVVVLYSALPNLKNAHK